MIILLLLGKLAQTKGLIIVGPSEACVRTRDLKAGLSEEKLSLMPCLRTFSNVLNALSSKAKQLRIVLKDMA